MTQRAPQPASTGIASLLAKHGIRTDNGQTTAQCGGSPGSNSPPPEPASLSTEFHMQYGEPLAGAVEAPGGGGIGSAAFKANFLAELGGQGAKAGGGGAFRPASGVAGLAQAGAAGLNMQSLQDELRLIQDERRALMHKTHSMAGGGGGAERSPQSRPALSARSEGGSRHPPSASQPGGAQHPRRPSSGTSGNPYVAAAAPGRATARRPSDTQERQRRHTTAGAPTAKPPKSAAASDAPPVEGEAELRRALLNEISDAIEAAFQEAAQPGKGHTPRGRTAAKPSGKAQRSDVQAVAAFAVGAAQLQVEAASEELVAKWKARQAKAVAGAEARAEERISDAVRAGREAREAAAAATAEAQQARADVERLRAERKSLQERLERWRKEKEATQNANSDLGARMEEALKVERAAGKEATKHGKRADKAEEECRRLQAEVESLQAELQREQTNVVVEQERAGAAAAAGAEAQRAALAALRADMRAWRPSRRRRGTCRDSAWWSGPTCRWRWARR